MLTRSKAGGYEVNMSDQFNAVMMDAFQDELEKQSGAAGYGLAAMGGAGLMYGAGKAKHMYGLAKKEQGEQNDEKMVKRMQAVQERIALRKRYGSAFSQG